MNKYLIRAVDVSIHEFSPTIVHADSADAALKHYLAAVYSKDKIFRDDVYDLAVNMSFAEKFHLASDQEQLRFNTSGTAGTEREIIISRVKRYFSSNPELGELYLRYMETEDKNLLGDKIFEFIALATTASEHGLVAVDMGSFPESAVANVD